METSFGNWVRRRRKALDFTQEELAQRVGCSTSAIFKIEADERRPSRQIAELLAAQLEVPPDQRSLFLKVARQEKAVTNLVEIPQPSVAAPVLAPAPPHIPDLDGAQRKNVLPVFPAPLVGRQHEIDILVKQLLDPACRLLTLTGPGGVGKTRLATEVARRLETRFADGVFFLSMAAVSQPESILPAVADILGVVFSGPADPKLQVFHHLGKKEILLVFDNMEHLTAGSAIMAEFLEQAPKIKMLLTSREQVHLRWEWVFEVQGLPVPEEASLDMLDTNSAASLFLQRARQATQDIELNSEAAAALVRICKSVDGLPLAIELAASWMRVMSFQEIALELEQGLDLLETTLQDVPERHRSMKIVFDHSWKLLTREERAVLTKLALFSGGFSRRAAEAVAGASLLMLSSLVSKSLLRYSKKTDRYDMHEFIHQSALARLHETPADEAQGWEKLSQYYSSWIASMEAPLKSDQQMQTSTQIRANAANWNAAWRWAVQNRRLEMVRRMVPCLYWYYEIHGHYAAALASYRLAVDDLRAAGAPACLSTPEENATFAFLVDQLAWFSFRTGEIEQANDLFEEGLELARESNDAEVLYHIYGNWGYMALLKGDIEGAKRLTIESLACARALRSPWHIAIPTNVLGIVELQQGNLSGAYRQLTDSLAGWRAVGDPRGLVFCMLYLSAAAMASGDYENAAAILEESNSIAAAKMDRWAQAFGLDLLGQANIARGQSEKAPELFRQSLAFSQEIGDTWGSTQTLIHMGEAQAALGFESEAKHLFRKAYWNAQQAKWTPTIFEVLIAFISIDRDLSPETKLMITAAVLAHGAAPPSTRQRAELLSHQMAPALTSQQAEAVRKQAGEKSPEMWAHEILQEVFRA